MYLGCMSSKTVGVLLFWFACGEANGVKLNFLRRWRNLNQSLVWGASLGCLICLLFKQVKYLINGGLRCRTKR